jgi:hypothetical protein
LQDFEPISPPQNIVKTDKMSGGPLQPVQPSLGNPIFEKGQAGSLSRLANYNSIYNVPTELDGYYQNSSAASTASSQKNFDRYMEKLNYLIHLLEEQQQEKNAGTTEEFILYCLFGVFVIFVIDSFARYGKNVGQASVRPRYKR